MYFDSSTLRGSIKFSFFLSVTVVTHLRLCYWVSSITGIVGAITLVAQPRHSKIWNLEVSVDRLYGRRPHNLIAVPRMMKHKG